MEARQNVRIIEVGPRDGLQNIAKAVPTATKIEFIERLRAVGLRTIEATSAVSPKAIPQLADNQTLLSNSSIQRLIAEPSTRVPVLVPNVRGLELAIKHGVKEVAVFVSATEGFSKANTNCTVEEGLRRAGEVAARAIKAGLQVRGYISCIFEDPFDGPTPEAAVLHVVRRQLDMGCYEISLGDTIGTGTASDVTRLLKYLYSHGVPAEKLAGHFHDTYGQAVSNVWAAFKLGVRAFDSSAGGLGGCPYAPGAKGNVATEDLVYLFERAGVSTGVNLMELVKTGQWISGQLQKSNDSRVGTALARKIAPSTSPSKQTTTKKLEWKPSINTTEGILQFRSGPNVKIVLDRPKNGNALTVPMIFALTSFFESAATDQSISRIALTASGKFFCTGMDLGKSSPVAKSAKASDEQFDRLSRLFEAISNAPQVTIAVVNGPAFGGGVGLAFACDIRIGAANVAFTLSEVKLGLSPATISKYVIREWGLAFSREAMLSGRPVSFAELRSLGIVALVVDSKEQLDDALDAYLLKLRAAAPKASTLVKELVAASGSANQDMRIKQVFDEMMKTGGESEFGLKEFQAGNRNIDWDAYVERKQKSKL
ncbi:3-hydroxy-3-methylglutaryl-coenzyme A lyase/3-methylglutaconyl-coenzyme A hydratase [Phaeosphaeria sp. MPI-PUGE-AT-0046c]|nr:3-hydroxy-3-methylglutaryl-coenzyme A lyase/3-methylglutaconyl-coenzyme A hydratase [Phaeosphaeria sp. MPI-PUGE-AT-0046c]